MKRIINKTYITIVSILYLGFFSYSYVFATDPPVAVNDYAITNEDVQLPIDVLDNDTDPQGNIDPTKVTIINTATHGTLSVNPFSGLVIYTSEPNFYGTDNFTYEICDTDGFCDQAIVTITVNPINDSINAEDDFSETQENSPVTISILDNDSDEFDPFGNIDTKSLSIVRPPENGTVAVDPFTNNVVYIPNAGFRGTDFYIYEICDDGYPLPATCDSATVTIKVDYNMDIPINVPNGFSPNGDGVNDYFVIPEIEEFPGNELFVYNRWGSKVYSATSYDNTWDGKSNNNMAMGEPLAAGTYYYVLSLGDGLNSITGYVYINH